MPSTQLIERKQVISMMSAIKEKSTKPARDCAIIGILYGTGITLSELAGLRIHDVSRPDGSIRDEVVLDNELAFNGAPRTIYLSSPSLKKLVHECLEERALFAKKGVKNLILQDSGEPFQASVSRVVEDKKYMSYQDLSVLIKQIHVTGGVPNGSADSARRSFSVWLARGDITGYPVHLDWIRQLRGDVRLSNTHSAIGKDLPEDFDPIKTVCGDIFKNVKF